ncbi:APC family permease [Demequina sediminicola]|uniref:APC family permease n=1 Tax=Demequina sediminicola TaxID=1095026 RepID=UPI000782B643|nr:APC family permease [Demequina sediminicola]
MTSQRRISLLAAIGIGVGSMIGAGVFSDLWVDVLAVGRWYWLAIVVAALVALANALSTAQLASRYPVAGGAYSYGRAELGPIAGHIAGAAFVGGKTVSVAVGAGVLGAYVLPGNAAGIATAAIVLAWALNSRGITRTAAGATVIAIVVVTALVALVVMATVASDPTVSWAPSVALLDDSAGAADAGGPPFLVAVAATFFAFAGYARIATLGEEVREPARNIPRAIVTALAIVVVVYLGVAFALHRHFGAPFLIDTDGAITVDEDFAAAPLDALAAAVGMPVWIITVAAALSIGGALLAVMAGAGRTAMAMAREGDLPARLAHQGTSGAPWRAEGAIALVAIALVWTQGVSLILVSAASVLTYYAVANIAAVSQQRGGRTAALRVPVAVSIVGLAASALLAVVAVQSSAASVWPTVALLVIVVGWPLVAAAIRKGRNAPR